MTSYGTGLDVPIFMVHRNELFITLLCEGWRGYRFVSIKGWVIYCGGVRGWKSISLEAGGVI